MSGDKQKKADTESGLPPGSSARRTKRYVVGMAQTPATNGQSPVSSRPSVIGQIPASAVRRTIPSGSFSVVEVDPDDVASLQSLPGVAFVEEDTPIRLADQLPSDPLLAHPDAWSFGAFPGVNAFEAWLVAEGVPETILAVIDTGIDTTHPDFPLALWTNPGEVANNGLDDDGNGYVDDVSGWNFYDRTNQIEDVYGHGTHVAGIMAARAHNGLGIAGICYNCRLLPLKIFSDLGESTVSIAAEAVRYVAALRAAGHNIVAMNMSYGGDERTQTELSALIEAGRQRIIGVAAAGNSAANNSENPLFPAGFARDLDTLISVGATQADATLAEYSNFGDLVHIAAPGSRILSTYPLGKDGGFGVPGYASLYGTSMAAPFVTGTIGLMQTVRPRSPTQVKSLLMQSGHAVSALQGKILSSATLDSGKAVEAALDYTFRYGIRGAIAVDSTPFPGAAIEAFVGGTPLPVVTTGADGSFITEPVAEGASVQIAPSSSLASFDPPLVVATAAESSTPLVFQAIRYTPTSTPSPTPTVPTPTASPSVTATPSVTPTQPPTVTSVATSPSPATATPFVTPTPSPIAESSPFPTLIPSPPHITPTARPPYPVTFRSSCRRAKRVKMTIAGSGRLAPTWTVHLVGKKPAQLKLERGPYSISYFELLGEGQPRARTLKFNLRAPTTVELTSEGEGCRIRVKRDGL